MYQILCQERRPKMSNMIPAFKKLAVGKINATNNNFLKAKQ